MGKMKTIKELKEVYGNTANQSRELFIKQYHYFRAIMCSKDKTYAEKTTAFEDLSQAYIRCALLDSDKTLFLAITQEWEMRLRYENILEIY